MYMQEHDKVYSTLQLYRYLIAHIQARLYYLVV